MCLMTLANPVENRHTGFVTFSPACLSNAPSGLADECILGSRIRLRLRRDRGDPLRKIKRHTITRAGCDALPLEG